MEGPEELLLERAVAILRAGGLVAVPTETVYGLAADALSPAAVDRLFEVKGRPAGRPLPVLVPGLEEAAAFARELSPVARRLAEALWPGPLTLVVPAAPGLPSQLTAGGDTIGLRVPDHVLALGLLRAFGAGLATPSANRSGSVSPTSAAAVRAELGEDVELVLDGGVTREGVESTVVDVCGPTPRILRLGAVGEERLAEVLGGSQLARTEGSNTTSFRPRTPWEWVERERLAERIAGVLAEGDGPLAVLAVEPAPTVDAGAGPAAHVVELPADEGARARVFYERLRLADSQGASRLLIESPPDSPWGRVLRQRLRAGEEGGRGA